MKTFVLHFAMGITGSLLLFLLFARLSGVKSFSAPFQVVIIGLACGALAHFASPWATPAVLLFYLGSCVQELRLEREMARQASVTNDKKMC